VKARIDRHEERTVTAISRAVDRLIFGDDLGPDSKRNVFSQRIGQLIQREAYMHTLLYGSPYPGNERLVPDGDGQAVRFRKCHCTWLKHKHLKKMIANTSPSAQGARVEICFDDILGLVTIQVARIDFVYAGVAVRGALSQEKCGTLRSGARLCGAELHFRVQLEAFVLIVDRARSRQLQAAGLGS
jgi:hypothetical protein